MAVSDEECDPTRDQASWIQYGIDRGWATEPQCGTHDGTPYTRGEADLFDEGGDPCVGILRLLDEGQTLDDTTRPW